MIDAMGIGLIIPVMPDLIQEVRAGDLAQAALWGGILSTVFAVMQFLFGPVLGGLSDQPVFEAALLDEDRVYEAQLRMRLDTSKLPKPFQIDAIGSDEWDVSSSWFRWTIRGSRSTRR